MLQFFDADRCCSDKALRHELSVRCLCPRFEETPSLCRLPPKIPRYSSRTTLSNWCSGTESADTSHSERLTKAGNKLDAFRLRRKYEANMISNQKLATWPRDIHVDTDSRQSKLCPELIMINQLLASAQMQHFNEGGNITPRFRSTAPVSSTMKPSLSSPVVALLRLDSWHSPHNQALSSLLSPTSDVGRRETVCCLESAAKVRGNLESAQTRPCDKYGKRYGCLLSQNLWVQSQRTA